MLSFFDNIVDKIVIQAGRVKMPQEVTDAFNSIPGRFDETGTYFMPFSKEEFECFARNQIYITGDVSQDQSHAYPENQELPSGVFNSFKLQAAESKDYTQLLKDKNLSNCVYMYANNDSLVGGLLPEELDFLQKKGVFVELVQDGGHGLNTGDPDAFMEKDLGILFIAQQFGLKQK